MLGLFTSDQVIENERRGLWDCAHAVAIKKKIIRAAKAEGCSLGRFTMRAVD